VYCRAARAPPVWPPAAAVAAPKHRPMPPHTPTRRPVARRVIFVAHFLACFWYGVGALAASGDAPEVWYTAYDPDSSGGAERDTSELYLWSMYWALATLTTVGYGDIVPVNNLERAYSCFALLAGGLIFGFLISELGALIASLDRQAGMVEEKLDSVREYADSRSLTRQLTSKLKRHFKYFYTRQTVFDEVQLLEDCPPALRAEVTQFILSNTLGKLPLFAGRIDPEFQGELFPLIKPVSFAAGEVIYTKGETSRELLFLLQGEVDVLSPRDGKVDRRLTPTQEIFIAANKLLATGEPPLIDKFTGCFGESVVTGHRRTNTVVAYTYCEVRHRATPRCSRQASPCATTWPRRGP
jgi:hypothetical protein